MKEYCKRQQLRWQEVLEILELLQNSLRGVSSLEVWEEQMREYENGLQQGRQTQEGVVLMTMHSCKGLEYPYVFLPDCNEGKIPHTKAISQEEIEEERRMFYVAMTRAIRHLEVLYLEDKKDGYLQKSRFIERGIKKFGDRFDYSKVKYVNCNTLVDVIDKESDNEVFSVKPSSFLASVDVCL